MKIKHIKSLIASLPLRRPMKTGGAEIKTVENIFVRIETDDGFVGWGEASAAPRMTGETVASIVAAINYLTPALVGRSRLPQARVEPPQPSARNRRAGRRRTTPRETAFVYEIGHRIV